MNLQYGPVGKQDIEVIFSLSKELVESYEDKTLVDFRRIFPWMRQKLETNIGSYTCVTADGKKAGYFCLNTAGERAELDDLYILPEFRGCGIGTEILKRCIDSVDKPIFLYVFKSNTGAISLYERMGFTVVEDVSPTRSIMERSG